MGQTREPLTHNLAERVCGQAARRDDARVARRLQRTPEVAGVQRLDEGALRDDFCHCWRELGVLDRMEGIQGTALQREMGPVGQSRWRQGVKTLLGIARMQARPALLCSDAALRQLGGCKAQQVRHGVCQRGAATRQQPRPEGPMGPDTLAHNSVQLHRQDLEAQCNGPMRALAKAGICGAKGTGRVAATALETTAAYAGRGQATRTRKSTAKQGNVHALEVTADGWQPLVWSDAITPIPLAITVVPIHAHAVLARRALVTQARTTWAGSARIHQVVCDQGLWDGVDRWGLDQHGITCVVPAQDHLAVTVEARAPAAAGAGVTRGRRGHTVRHGPGQTVWTERRETEVVGIAGLTTDGPYGTPEHGRHHNRRDFAATPIPAVVVRQWHGRDDGPGGTTVFLTTASVQQPWHPFDEDDDRSLLENGGIQEAKPPWDLGHPPQNTGRAVRVHVVCTCLLFARATAYRRRCEQAELRAEPVGWQRWRRPLLEQTRDQVIVCAQRWYGSFHIAEFALLVGVTLKDVPPGMGTREDVLATYGLTAEG